jgi:hypothetical protein
MASITLPEKLTAKEIKGLSDKAKQQIQVKIEKITIKGHLIDEIDLSDTTNFGPEDRRAFQIPVFHYEADVTGFGVRRRSSGVAVRGERSQAAKVLKQARAVVKAMNAGETFPPLVLVPTGRPRGRQKAS